MSGWFLSIFARLKKLGIFDYGFRESYFFDYIFAAEYNNISFIGAAGVAECVIGILVVDVLCMGGACVGIAAIIFGGDRLCAWVDSGQVQGAMAG